MPRRVIRHDPVWIPLSDGIRLAATVWLPEDAEADPVPAILEPIPYRRRDGTAERDAIGHPWMAAHGYAVVRVDLRGSGDSGGVLDDEYLMREQADGLEVLAWMAAQPWCTGRTGLYGISWGGFAALQIAALRPPSLGAIVPVAATDDRFADDVHYKGGALLTENPAWAAVMHAYQSRPPDPAIVGAGWRDIWLSRLARPPWTAPWLKHQARDGYWRHGSVCEDWSAIEVPILSVSGWVDGYVNPVFRLLENARAPVKALLGPWGHRYPHIARPGPAIGFLQEVRAWWDRWLKDARNQVDDWPDMRAYIQEPAVPMASTPGRAGTWLAVRRWPAPGTVTRVLYPTLQRLANEPGPPGETATVADGAWTAAASGRWLAFGDGPEQPLDQRDDDHHGLAMDTRPLGEAVAILGQPVLRATVAADRPLAKLVARLCAVGPDGVSRRLSWGVQNLAHVPDPGSPRARPPGTPIEVRLVLNGMADRVAAGDRLRLVLSTEYWPLLWPSPRPATLTVALDRCRLELPLAPDGGDWRFEPPQGAPPLAVEALSAGMSSRDVQVSPDGTEEIRVRDDRGHLRFKETGQTMHAVSEETWRMRPGDPDTASHKVQWRIRLGWPGGPQVETVTRQVMTGDAGRFRVRACLEASENGSSAVRHDWEFEIDRDFV